jgi:phospholipid transport system substrate-binding protein
MRELPLRVSRRGFVIAVASRGALSPGSAGAQTGSATQFMNQLAGQVVALVEDRMRPAGPRRREFQILLENAFDTQKIARFDLGRYWTQFDDEQRRQYLAMFPAYMAGYYWMTFDTYSDAGFVVLSERSDGNGGTIVHSQIALNDQRPPIGVDWHIVTENGAFKIADVDVQGLSQNLSYRDYFANLIQKNGGQVSVVLDTMRQHINH